MNKQLSKIVTGFKVLFKGANPFYRYRLYQQMKKEVSYWNRTNDWQPRIEDAVECPDNAFIERVPDAGKRRNGSLVMHNGIKIVPGSYCDEGMTRLLQENKGVHEPQEERAFAEVIKYMPHRATMLELGAWWAFYSMSFYREVKEPCCYLVEPEEENLRYGQANFELNQMKGNFFPGFIDSKYKEGEIPVLSVDYIMEVNQIEELHILHADIQSYEYQMLLGAEKALDAGKIHYLFISTHSNRLHYQCIHFLENKGFDILCEIDMLETYSFDGLIVAKKKGVSGPEKIKLSKKKLK